MGMRERFRVRLRVHMGKALTSDEHALLVQIGGRDVQIKSQKKDEILRSTKWIVLTAGGFDSEDEAWSFGEQLKLIVCIVGVCTRIGIDVGEDQTTSWINENWAREKNLIEPEERVLPNVHGLSVYPDDSLSRVPTFGATGVVTYNPVFFIEAIAELGNSVSRPLGAASTAVQVLNLALKSTEPLTKVVLAISIIEGLGQDQDWTPN